MSDLNDGGPAFPGVTMRSDRGLEWSESCEGMTLRDYFAAKVMAAFMDGAVLPPGFDASEQLAFAAKRAYEVADAMLAARGAQ